MSEARQNPIAIVGIGCRFPGGVNDADSFYRSLFVRGAADRRRARGPLGIDRFYHPNPAAVGAMVMRRGGFVDNLSTFDAAFWGLSPREAVRMNPQQRWLLEVSWEALEDAGVRPSRLRLAAGSAFSLASPATTTVASNSVVPSR